MCGQYRLTVAPEILHEQFGTVEIEAFPPRPLILPNEPVLIVRREEDGRRHLRHVLWGLIPAWVKDARQMRRIINARAETLTEKPSFRGAVRHRRCLVPADGFYEWSGARGRRRAHLFTRSDGAPFAMAGLWECWMDADGGEIETMAIITLAANADVAPVHERMPAILREESWDAWLDVRGVRDREAARLLKPAPEGFLRRREAGASLPELRGEKDERPPRLL